MSERPHVEIMRRLEACLEARLRLEEYETFEEASKEWDMEPTPRLPCRISYCPWCGYEKEYIPS